MGRLLNGMPKEGRRNGWRAIGCRTFGNQTCVCPRNRRQPFQRSEVLQSPPQSSPRSAALQWPTVRRLSLLGGERSARFISNRGSARTTFCDRHGRVSNRGVGRQWLSGLHSLFYRNKSLFRQHSRTCEVQRVLLTPMG